ncbi:unnamed protein product [Hymenolepis diminuta]|uniref:Clathrin_bdg domain-containing protein n=1 Tax=Hymenolepis diminuta TaxID=6216 RepID=A0A0R3SBK6_HYMDI|nr:unnamed protein product [Hymenolepis diminuta]
MHSFVLLVTAIIVSNGMPVVIDSSPEIEMSHEPPVHATGVDIQQTTAETIAVASNGNPKTSFTPVGTEITHFSNPMTTEDEIHQSSLTDFESFVGDDLSPFTDFLHQTEETSISSSPPALYISSQNDDGGWTLSDVDDPTTAGTKMGLEFNTSPIPPCARKRDNENLDDNGFLMSSVKPNVGLAYEEETTDPYRIGTEHF